MNTVTIKLDVPEIVETKAFTKVKGNARRAKTAKVIQHKPGEWHDTVIAAVWHKGVQRFANDYFASESDPEQKADRIAAMVEAFNEGETLAKVTGKTPRAKSAGSDPVLIAARSLLRKVLKAELGPDEYKRDYTDADAADQIARLDALLTGDEPHAKAERIMAAAKTQVDAIAGLIE